MRKHVLDLLLCPSCKQSFILQQGVEVNTDNIVYGVIRCHCSSYPIVDGILIFKRSEKTRRIIKCVTERKPWQALKKCFDYRPDLNKMLMATAANASIGYKLLGYVMCLITFSKSRTNFSLFRLLDLAGKLRIQTFWTTYLKHRFSATSFRCAVPFLNLVDAGSKFVIDIGCGMGIFSYMMSKRIPEESIICQNLEFTGVYLARKYFVPGATFICSDAGERQPFPDEMFDVVFSCDALYCIAHAEQACEEIARLLSRKGIAILAHNHHPRLRDYSSQTSRGGFYDPDAFEKFFKGRGMSVELEDEERMYKKLFPSTLIDMSK